MGQGVGKVFRLRQDRKIGENRKGHMQKESDAVSHALRPKFPGERYQMIIMDPDLIVWARDVGDQTCQAMID